MSESTEHRADPAYREAWKALLLFPLTFVLAVVVHVMLWVTLGYSLFTGVGTDVMPSHLAATLMWLLASTICAIPEVVAVHHARQAARAGEPAWHVPVLVGGMLAVVGAVFFSSILSVA